MNKLFRLIATLIVVGILITACGAQPAEQAPAEQAPAEPAAATQEPAADTQAEAEAEAPTPAPTEAPATEEADASSKILRLRVLNDITNIDPAFHPSNADTITSETVHQGLVTYKPGTWEVVNVLAESIEQSEDGLEIDFKLKEGVQFHKGFGELTAEDVKFSYERFIDEKLDASYKGDWETLDHVEVTGKYTGKIILKKPFAPLWTSTLPVTGGVIISKKAVEEKGVEGYAMDPIGTGPYEFVEWTPNEKLVLKRFEDYWGEPSEWDEIHLMPIVDDSAAEIALETGEVDFAEIPLDSVERFEANDKFETRHIDTLNYNGLLMNVQHPNLEDIKVREAIRYAVDVPAIIEGAYNGRFARQCALVAPGQIGYWEDEPCYERDVEKAKEFLAEANVDTLDLTLTVFNDEVSRTVAEIIQANLADVGINVEIIAQDEAAYWDGGFGDAGLKERQLTFIDWSTSNPDPSWTTVWFTCDQILQWNWMYWCDEEFTRLHKEALSELDPEKRAEMYLEMQKIWDEAVHTVWVAHPTKYFAFRTDLEPSLSPNGSSILWNFRSK